MGGQTEAKIGRVLVRAHKRERGASALTIFGEVRRRAKPLVFASGIVTRMGQDPHKGLGGQGHRARPDAQATIEFVHRFAFLCHEARSIFHSLPSSPGFWKNPR